MIYRIASSADIQELTEIRALFLAEEFGEGDFSEEKTVLPDYFSRHLGNDLTVFVADDGGRIAAAVFLMISEKPANPRFPRGMTGTVMNVFTRREYRRRGIAGALMKMLIEYAENAQLDIIELKASESGYPLYKKLGFEEDTFPDKPMKYIVSKEKKCRT